MNTEDIEELLHMPSQDEGVYTRPFPNTDEIPAQGHIRLRSSLGPATTGRLTAVIATVLVIVVVAAGFIALRTPLSSGNSPSPGANLAADSYTCGGSSFTPANARDIDAATLAAALDVLHGTTARLGSALPVDRWQIARESSTAVLFVAQGDGVFPWKFVVAAPVSGDWTAKAYGDCEPAVPPAVTTAQFGFAQWVVIGAEPNRSSIDVQVQSDFCWQTYLGSTVWYTKSTVVVTYWTRLLPEPSDRVCALNLQFQPSTLQLAEPLGIRAIMAGPASAEHPADAAPTSGG